jgi:hypothetical protein
VLIKAELPLTEQQQVLLSEVILTERGFRVYKEVPLFSSSIDMVLLNERNELTAIEFKLFNWKKALDQVKKHSICFDYLYICLLKQKTKEARKKVEHVCVQSGIGLFYFSVREDGRPILEEVQRPRKIENTWQKKKNDLIKYLLGH